MAKTSIYMLVGVLTELADKIDENKQFWNFTVNKELDLSLGRSALSSYLRDGAKEIITLQGRYQNAREDVYWLQEDVENFKKVLEDIFGDSDADEIILDEWKSKFRQLYKELCDAEETEGSKQ